MRKALESGGLHRSQHEAKHMGRCGPTHCLETETSHQRPQLDAGGRAQALMLGSLD